MKVGVEVNHKGGFKNAKTWNAHNFLLTIAAERALSCFFHRSMGIAGFSLLQNFTNDLKGQLVDQ